MPSTLDAVARQAICDRRATRVLSTAALVARLREQGWHNADRFKIDKIERGTRGLSLEEFLHMAIALDISPADLLMGTPTSGRPGAEPISTVRVCGYKVTPRQIQRWFAGRAPLLPSRSGKKPQLESLYWHTPPEGDRPQWFEQKPITDLETAVDRLVNAFHARSPRRLRSAEENLRSQVDTSVRDMIELMGRPHGGTP